MAARLLCITVCLCLSLLVMVTPASLGQGEVPPLTADLILINAQIWTGDPRQPTATALAAWQGRLIYVGDGRTARRFNGPGTKVIDAQGKLVVPGLHDSHAHILGAGLGLSRVQLKDAMDEAEFGRRLQAFDQKLPKDRWLLGGDWDHDRTFQGTLPTAALVDKYVKDRPVFLRRYDGHMALANTLALKLAGITAETPDPQGGEIVRLAGGRLPSGILRDTAMGLIAGAKLIPSTSISEIAEAVKAALNVAREVGVTSLEDMDGSDAATRSLLLRVYQDMAQRNELTLRIQHYTPLADWRSLAERGVRAGYGSDWLRIGSLKGFVDGSLGSSTAKMFQPYVHEPKNSGVYVTPPSRLQELCVGADQAGLAIAIHAIGDEGNGAVLDVYDRVAKQNPLWDRRFRIEHAQILNQQQYRRFAVQKVIASMQPYHIIDDGRWAEGRIGTERCRNSYACRSLLDNGVTLAFGSDWPVAPLSPLLGIDAAVNRRTLDGKHPKGWFPEQSITVTEALTAYTRGSAYASRQEKDKGTLTLGKLADFVILSRNILAPEEKDHIADTQVMMTVVGGKIVFERK